MTAIIDAVMVSEVAPVKRKVSALEARKRLGEILESVYYRGDEVVVERAGKPMAVVISAERYEAIEREREQAFERVFRLIDQAQERNRDVPAEEIERDIASAIQEVRTGHRADESRP